MTIDVGSGMTSSTTRPGIVDDGFSDQVRQVFFIDAADLALGEAGVIARARRVRSNGDDSVVDLRPGVPAELPSKLRRLVEETVGHQTGRALEFFSARLECDGVLSVEGVS